MGKAGAADPEDIRNWQRRSATLTTSGKLDPPDPARLAAIGVRHVINLAMDDHPEALEDEAALMDAHGITYTHIPIAFDAPQRAHLDAFRDAMAKETRPLHVHCIANYRVSALLFILDIEQGVAREEAKALMDAIWNPLDTDDPRGQVWARFIRENLPG